MEINRNISKYIYLIIILIYFRPMLAECKDSKYNDNVDMPKTLNISYSKYINSNFEYIDITFFEYDDKHIYNILSNKDHLYSLEVDSNTSKNEISQIIIENKDKQCVVVSMSIYTLIGGVLGMAVKYLHSDIDYSDQKYMFIGLGIGAAYGAYFASKEC